MWINPMLTIWLYGTIFSLLAIAFTLWLWYWRDTDDDHGEPLRDGGRPGEHRAPRAAGTDRSAGHAGE